MSYSQLLMKSGYPHVHLANGIGRYVCQLQRVTLKFCKSHGSSRGMRDFIENDLIDYAKENPGVVVYLKPRRHRSPIINAEYLSGEKHWVGCRNYTREEIIKWMELLRTQGNDGSALRLRKYWHTDFPSIQGPWTPFTFRKPEMNFIEFPDNELGASLDSKEQTATEKVKMIFQQQQITDEIGEELIQRGDSKHK